tara:strand:- start:80 stop:271 length:192 start_codon:yes stop_codon:yes gene_type:complete
VNAFSHLKAFEIKKAEKIFGELGINIIRGGASNQKADIMLDVSQIKKILRTKGKANVIKCFWK